MSTVSLQIIVKDEGSQVAELVTQSVNYFDAINLTVSDKPTADKLAKAAKAVPKVHVKYRQWNDCFDEARNANFAMCDTTYAFWLDADDTFDFACIPELVRVADKNKIDAIFLPYNYAQDEFGNCITRHWRERLIRMDKGYSWRGRVHETFISDEPVVTHKINQEVVHQSSEEHAHNSVSRNHAILEKACQETDDPRYMHYLGMSYFAREEYEKSINILLDYLKVGGNPEDIYRSLAVVSEAAYHLKRYDMAMEYASKCTTLKPKYPMGFWLLAQYEADQDNWSEALEWVKVGLSKPDPNTLSVFNPMDRERAILIAAQAEFMRAHYKKALDWVKQIPKNSTAADLLPTFEAEAEAELFVNLLPRMRKFFASDTVLWSSLCHDIKYDTRIRTLRQIATEPKEWGDKSLVIFCGQGYEEWGPHTLDKGMGGSEEAVIYLSSELAKLGWQVVVYGEVPSAMDENGYNYKHKNRAGGWVMYLPWKEIDTRDKFNIFVSWRAPQYLEKITAKVKLADIHDVLPESIMKDYPDVTYLVKSAYHRSLAPKLADDKFRIIGNGIKKDQFND